MGGMLRFGIPPYRLPNSVLDQEIDDILALGVELKTGQTMGRDYQIETLKDQGFDAVYLSIGAMAAKPADLPGDDAVLAEHLRPGSRQRDLADGGGRLALLELQRPLGELQQRAAEGDGAGGDDQHVGAAGRMAGDIGAKRLQPALAQRALRTIDEQRGADLHDDAAEGAKSGG